MKICSSILVLAFCFLVSCKQSSVQSTGWERSSDGGQHYSFYRVLIDDFEHPVFVVGRFSDKDRSLVAEWVSSAEGFTLSGVILEPGSSPLLYFSENRSVKKLEIAKSGLWSPLFKDGGPTIDELDAILQNAVDTTRNAKG